MPIERCGKDGKGYRWGKSGKCFRNRKDAVRQGQAIEISKHKRGKGNFDLKQFYQTHSLEEINDILGGDTNLSLSEKTGMMIEARRIKSSSG